MIEVFLCDRGDVFVSEDRRPRWSPYGNEEKYFYRHLLPQPHVLLKFDDMEDLREMMPGMLNDWMRQAYDIAKKHGDWPKKQDDQ